MIEKIESEMPNDGSKSFFSTPERSNCKMTTDHSKDGNDGDPSAFPPPDNVAQLEKDSSAEALKNAESHGSHQPHLSLGDSLGGEKTTSLQVHENELAVENKNVTPDSIVEKGLPHPHIRSNLHTPSENSNLPSMGTPQRRHRSSSPGATIENTSKRPATICDFFARGWCIKGNSCKFLHEKEGIFNITPQIRNDQSGRSRKADFLDNTGSREEAERLRLSASEELVDPSNTESSSKSPSLLQRALVRAYGGEKHGSPQFHDEHNMHGAQKSRGDFLRFDVSQSARAFYPPKDEFRQTSVLEECKRRYGVSPRFDSADETKSFTGDFLSKRYLNEGSLYQGMPTGGFLNASPFTKESSLTRNSVVPEHSYYSGGSSTSYSLHQNSSNYHGADKRTDYFSIQNQQSQFPLRDSHTSYSLTSSFNSSFSSPTKPVRLSPSIHAFAHGGISLGSGSTPLSAEHLDTLTDRENYGSRSTSLPRNSSPFHSRTEVENIAQNNIPRDLPASSWQKTPVHDDWKPSVPFRSSFCSAPENASSHSSQYDPLLDSIDPPKAGNITFQTSQMTPFDNSGEHNGHHILPGNHNPGYNSQKPLNLFPETHEAIEGKDASAYGLSGYTAMAAATGSNELNWGNNSVPTEDKDLNAGHMVGGANINEADLGGNSRSQEDKGRNNKESKTLRFFRSALVDFVKELVKPSWREGHLSKDAHKMIVKKAAEKVLSAMQPHQIPNTTESVNQYLSASRPKLLKLVEGYVEKYAKS